MKMEVYGKFSVDCDIHVAGWYGNGVVLDDVVDNHFKTRYEALQSIRDWALRVGAEVDEVSFD
jgi:hypothetical protein